MAEEQRLEEVQRWTAKRRAELVISLLKGETTAAEAPGATGLRSPRWKGGARARQKEDEALREEEINRLKRPSGIGHTKCSGCSLATTIVLHLSTEIQSFSLSSIKMCLTYLNRAVADDGDVQHRSQHIDADGINDLVPFNPTSTLSRQQ
jgi:hypothetical protein